MTRGGYVNAVGIVALLADYIHFELMGLCLRGYKIGHMPAEYQVAWRRLARHDE